MRRAVVQIGVYAVYFHCVVAEIPTDGYRLCGDFELCLVACLVYVGVVHFNGKNVLARIYGKGCAQVFKHVAACVNLCVSYGVVERGAVLVLYAYQRRFARAVVYAVKVFV